MTVLKIERLPHNKNLPEYKTEGAAGMDLCAAIEEPITLKPLERKLVPTGLRIELEHGYEAQIRPRSGLALKNGISIVNSPGTIDSDYRGDIGIILINHGFEPFMVEQGDRIPQMVITQHTQVEFVEVEELSDTDRGDGGFGHGLLHKSQDPFPDLGGGIHGLTPSFL